MPAALVLFDLYREQLRFVCGVCAGMRAGCPILARSRRWIVSRWRKTTNLNLSGTVSVATLRRGRKVAAGLVSVFDPTCLAFLLYFIVR